MRYILILVTAMFVSCNNISDRENVISLQDNVCEVDKFNVDKDVQINLVHENKIDLTQMKIVIIVDQGEVVFCGDYAELSSKKIKLPKSINNAGYLLSVKAIDKGQNKVYKWSSDVLSNISGVKLNTIELLYTGNKEESITLVVRS